MEKGIQKSFDWSVDVEMLEPLRENNFVCLVGNLQETPAEDIPSFSDANHIIDWVLMMSTCGVRIEGHKLELEVRATKDYVKRYSTFELMSVAPGYQGYVYLCVHTAEGTTLGINKLLCSYKGYKTKLSVESDDCLMITHEFEIVQNEVVLNVKEEQNKFSNLKGEHIFNVQWKEFTMAIYHCLSCGYEFSGNYCPKCGQPHEEKIAEKKQVKNKCAACGTMNESGSSFCVECGKSFSQLLMENDKE